MLDAGVLSIPVQSQVCRSQAGAGTLGASAAAGMWGQQRPSQLQRQIHSKRKRDDQITRQSPGREWEAAK